MRKLRSFSVDIHVENFYLLKHLISLFVCCDSYLVSKVVFENRSVLPVVPENMETPVQPSTRLSLVS